MLDQRLELTGHARRRHRRSRSSSRSRGSTLPDQAGFAGYVRDITDRKAGRGRAAGLARADRRGGGRARAGSSSATSTTARSSGSWSWRSQLRMARAKLDANPTEAAEFLDAAVDALTEATAELRELARGIHPVVLTEGGLRPALEALVERSEHPGEAHGRAGRALPGGGRGGRLLRRGRGAHERRPLLGRDARRGARRRSADGRLRVVVADDGRGERRPAGLGGARHRRPASPRVDGALERPQPGRARHGRAERRSRASRDRRRRGAPARGRRAAARGRRASRSWARRATPRT